MNSKYNEILSKSFDFWESLSKDEKKVILNGLSERTFNKGQCVHGGEKDCTGIIIMLSGCLRAYILSENGKEVTLYRLNKGDMCMLSASCVLESINFEVMVDAQVKSQCLILNSHVFSEISKSNPKVKIFALESTVKRFSDVMFVMQQILFMSFDKRLALFLLNEYKNNECDVINLTNEQIAKYMGSAREVVSRMLKYFKSEGIAERTKQGVKIQNIDKLNQIAGK